MKRCVIDASFCLAFLMPDEYGLEVNVSFASFIQGQLFYLAPTLLPYEIANAILCAVDRKRITTEEAFGVLQKFQQLDIALFSINQQHVLELAHREKLNIYDASYLSLSIQEHASLLTLDKRLKRASA